jgi:hypothetical protein
MALDVTGGCDSKEDWGNHFPKATTPMHSSSSVSQPGESTTQHPWICWDACSQAPPHALESGFPAAELRKFGVNNSPADC